VAYDGTAVGAGAGVAVDVAAGVDVDRAADGAATSLPEGDDWVVVSKVPHDATTRAMATPADAMNQA
jgi:hypothetical protein